MQLEREDQTTSRRDAIVKALGDQSAFLRGRGIVHVHLLVGDEDEQRVGLLVELGPEVGLFAFGALRQDLSAFLGRGVVLMTVRSLDRRERSKLETIEIF